MARSKMELVLEELAHVFTDETTAAMTGPITVPLGKSIESDVPSVDDPEGTAPLGKGKDEPGGDASFYDKEQKKSDFPYAKPGKTTESDSAPKVDDPEGKAVLGKGTAEKGGDAAHYGDEKTDSKYPFQFDPKKPGVKTEQDDPLAELEKLQKMAEEDPASEPVAEPAVPALDGGEPSLDAPEEPEEAPEEIDWELYLHSGDFDLISDRAMEVLKPIADAKVSIAVKFSGDEAKKNEVIDALTASGFVVLDVEKEGESEEPEDAETGDADVEVISGPAPAVSGAAPTDPAVMAEAKRRKAKKRHAKR